MNNNNPIATIIHPECDFDAATAICNITMVDKEAGLLIRQFKRTEPWLTEQDAGIIGSFLREKWDSESIVLQIIFQAIAECGDEKKTVLQNIFRAGLYAQFCVRRELQDPHWQFLELAELICMGLTNNLPGIGDVWKETELTASHAQEFRRLLSNSHDNPYQAMSDDTLQKLNIEENTQIDEPSFVFNEKLYVERYCRFMHDDTDGTIIVSDYDVWHNILSGDAVLPKDL